MEWMIVLLIGLVGFMIASSGSRLTHMERDLSEIARKLEDVQLELDEVRQIAQNNFDALGRIEDSDAN